MARTRRTDRDDRRIDYYVTKTRSHGSTTWTTNNATRLVGTYMFKVITDVEVPNFATLRKCSVPILPMNPVNIHSATVTFNPGTVKGSIVSHRPAAPTVWETTQTSGVQVAPDPLTKDDLFIEVPSVSDSIINSVAFSARSEALAPIWDALTDAAEAKQTQQMIVNALKALGKIKKRIVEEIAFAALKRVNPKKRRGRKTKLPKIPTPQELWLQYRYGIMPLVYSTQDAIKAFEKRVRRPGELTKGKSFVEIPFEIDKHKVVETQYGTTTYVSRLKGVHKVRSTCYGQVKKLHLAAWGNPAVTAWELVPLSFVVDWFVDVGSWLQSFATTGEISVVGQCVSIKTELERTVSMRYTDYKRSPPTGSTYNVASGGMESEAVTTAREDIYVRFAHTPSGFPAWNPQLTNLRLLDAAALFAVFVKSSR